MAKIKEVFTGRDEQKIPHLWYYQQQDSARNHGSFYFEKDTIYSYGRHFPIARHYEHKGVKAVLFTLRGYSMTTSQHIQAVKMAIPGEATIIYCWQIPNYTANEDNHDENFRAWLNEVNPILLKLSVARKPEIYLQQLEVIKNQAQKYFDYFKCKKSSKVWKLLQKALDAPLNDMAKFQAIMLKNREAEKAAKLKRLESCKVSAAKWIADYEQAITDFRNNAIHKLPNKPWNYELKELLADYHTTDILRISKDGLNVETSQGIDIPAHEAKRLYKWLIGIAANGGCEGNCNEMVSHTYQVKSVTSEYVVIGCHKITIEECKLAYSQL